jgi:hypothetical protein
MVEYSIHSAIELHETVSRIIGSNCFIFKSPKNDSGLAELYEVSTVLAPVQKR